MYGDSKKLMKGDRYLLTGGAGFLGSTIREVLSSANHVTTLGRSPENDYRADLARMVPRFTETFNVVVHNAGKAHVVPKTQEVKKDFFEVNVRGTENLLKGLASAINLPEAIIFISSIAVYGLTRGVNICEDAPLAAEDAYGKSKIEAEETLRKWCGMNGVSLSILRLPLLVGKNPPGNLGAMIRGMNKGLYFSIAGGKAKKSMVMAEDVASFVPRVARNPGIYNLTDGYHPSLRELEALLAGQMNVKVPIGVPGWTARILGKWGDFIERVWPGQSPVTTEKIEKLLSTLTFDDTRARNIGWRPRQVLCNFRIQ